MSDKQPEALRYADYIEYWNPDDPIAKELRRLHEANQALLEALGLILASDDWPEIERIARTAIAKGEANENRN